MVVDDTNRPQFDKSSWPWVVNKTHSTPSEDQCYAVKDEQVCGSKIYTVHSTQCSSSAYFQKQLCGYRGIKEFDCTGAVSYKN